MKSINPFKPAYRPGRSVVQTIYDIIKVYGAGIKVESKEGETRSPARLGHSGGDTPVGRGSTFIVQLPMHIQ